MNESHTIPRRRRLFYSAVALSGSLLLCEILVRLLLGTPWLYPGKSNEDPLMILHRARGYALRPDQNRRWTTEDFNVEVRTNPQGMRDEPLTSAMGRNVRIAAAGDSYTFGIGVESDETWPEQLESRLEGGPDGRSATVLNLGVPGYSARQIRLYLEEVWPEFEPQLAIVGLYMSSYWRVRSPYVLTGGTLISEGRARSVEVTPSGNRVITPFRSGPFRSADVWIKERFHLLAHLLHAPRTIKRWIVSRTQRRGAAQLREAYQPVIDELIQLHRFVLGKGGQLIVLAINRQEPDGTFSDDQAIYNEILASFCRTQGIPFVDPLPRLREIALGRPLFRFPTDLHWSEAAHRVAAEMIHEELSAQQLLPGATSAGEESEPRR